MATLGNIRKRSGLLIIAIGVALLAFLLSDLIRKGSLFRRNTDTVGVINGQKIGIRDFNDRVKRNTDLLKRQNPNSTSMDAVNQTWRQIERQVLIGQQAEKLGLTVGENQEWGALVSNPYIRQNRALYTEGKFDQAKFTNWLALLKRQRPGVYQQVLVFEQQIKRQALINSYFDLIKDGIYTSAKEAEIAYHFQNDAVDLQYVLIPFQSVKDKVTITPAEIQGYAEAHKKRFERPASRSIHYVLFDVKPSRSDRQAVSDQLEGLLHQSVVYNAITRENDTLLGFGAAVNPETFVNSQSDVNYDPNYKALSRFPDSLQTFLKGAREGQVYGPYAVGTTYRLSKLIDKTSLPDSVKVRHILVTYAGLSNAPKGVTRSRSQAEKRIDSLYKAVKRGAGFAELAKAFGEDATRDRGGALGWAAYGQFIPKFQNYAFTHKKGSLEVVETRFGFHLIEVLGREGFHPVYKVATIVRELSPSKQTEGARYAQAAEFFEGTKGNVNAFDQRARKQGLKLHTAKSIKELEGRIPGLGDSRDIVKWLYDEGTKPGDSHMFNQGFGSVVAFVTAESPKGLPPLSDLKPQIQPLLRKDKQLEILKRTLADNPDLKSAAKRYHTAVRSSEAVHFANPILTGAGREPRVVGTAFGMAENTSSGPLLGKNGFFLLRLTKKTPAKAASSYTGLQRNAEAQAEKRAPFYAYQALQDKATIENKLLELGY